MTRTVSRLFDSYREAEAAVHELEKLGFHHDDLSIVSNDQDRVRSHNTGGSAGGTSSHPAHDYNNDGKPDDSVNDHGDVTRGVSTGAALGGVAGLLAGIGALAIPGLGPIVAAGWLASTAAGAGIGALGGGATGGIVGALKNSGHTEEEAHAYSEGVRRGGTLVSARVSDERAGEVERLFERLGASNAQTLGTHYRETGWTRFDENAGPYDREGSSTVRHPADTPRL